ncbi:uncharacterized protein LOC112557717 isoform X2 [Pomacea canaliculata]|uniref:uncharacterized protein LOC112557717 isoform X2 n=1 Tax=Pomacea canaliculata TaxID=400727 RepID=UPI000D735F58|nr:uncharacterized protein LOC112557717 isoform X2 [Pomacea canaliculata]
MHFLPFNLKDRRVDATTRETERTDMLSAFGNVSVQTERNKKSSSDVTGVHNSGSDLKQPDHISSKQHNKHAIKNIHDLSSKISVPVVGSVEKIHPRETKYSSLSKEIADSGAAVDKCENRETANTQTKMPVTFKMLQKEGLQISSSARLSEDKKHQVVESKPVLSLSKRRKRSRKKTRQQNSLGQTQNMPHAFEAIPDKNHVSSVTKCISKSLKSCPLVFLSSAPGKQKKNLALSQNVKEESTFQHMPSNTQHKTDVQKVPPEQGKKKGKHNAKKSPDSTETKDYEEAMVRLAKGLRPKGFIYVGGLGKNPSDDPLPVLDRKIRMKKSAGSEKGVSPCCQPEKQIVKKTFKKKQVKGMTGYKKKRKRRMKMEDFVQNPSSVVEDEDININDFQFDDPVDFSETIPCEAAPCLDGELASSVQSQGGGEGKNCDKSVIIKHSASASSLGITSWTDALVRPSLQPQVLLVDLVKAYLKGADFDNCRICQNVIDLSLVEREEAENLPLPQDDLALVPDILKPGTAISDSSTLQKRFEPNSGQLTKDHISMQNTSDGKEKPDADLSAGDLVRKADGEVRGDDTRTQVAVSSRKQGSPGSIINSEDNSGASDVFASLDQENKATVSTLFGTLTTEHVSVSAKNSEQLYAGIDCVQIIPVKASEHTIVAAEINSQLDSSESFTRNTEKVDDVNSEESKNERVCSRKTLQKESGSQQESLRCSSLQEKSVNTKTTIKDLVDVPAKVIPVLIDKEHEESVNPCFDITAVNVVSKLSCILPEFEKDDTRYSSLASSYNFKKSPLFVESSIKSRSLVLNPSNCTGRKNNEKNSRGEMASVQWPDTLLQTKEVIPQRSCDVEVNEKRSVAIETVNLMESPSRLQSSSVNSHRNVKNWQQWKSLQAAQFSCQESENKKNAIDVACPKSEALKTSDIVCDGISDSGVLLDNPSLKLVSASTSEKQGSHVSSAYDNSSFFDMINKTSSFPTRNSIPGLDLIEEPPLCNISSVCDGLKFATEVLSVSTENVEQAKREILAAEEPSVSTALISYSGENDVEGACQEEGSSNQTACSRDQKIVLEQETFELPNVDGACRLPVEKLTKSPITLDISEAEREFSSDCLEEDKEFQISVKTRPVGIGCPIPSVAKQQGEIKNCINECEEQMSLKAVPMFQSVENLPSGNIGQRVENQTPHFIHQGSMQPQTVSYENMGNTISVRNIHQNSQQQPGYYTGKPHYVELGQPYFGSTARPVAMFLPSLPGFNQPPQSPHCFLPSPPQTFLPGGKQFPVQHLPNFQQSSAGNITFPMVTVLRHSAVGIVSPMVHGATVHGGDLNLANMPPSSAPSYNCNNAADFSKKPSMSSSVSGSDVYSWFSDILSGKRNLSPQGSKDTESSSRLGEVDFKHFTKSKDKTKRLKSENDDTSSDREKKYSYSNSSSSSKTRFKHFGPDDYFDMSHKSTSKAAGYSRSKTLQTDSSGSPSLKDGHSDRFRRKSECVGSDDSTFSPCFLKDRLSRSKRRTKYSRSRSSSNSSNLEKNRSSSPPKRKKKRTDSDDSRSSRGTKPKTQHLASEGFGRGHKKSDAGRGSSTKTSVSKTSMIKIATSCTKSLESETTGSKISRNRISDVATKEDTKRRTVLELNNKPGCTTSKAAVSGEVIVLDSKKKRKENFNNIQSEDALLMACKKSSVKDDLNTYMTGESGCPVVAQSDRSESAGSSFSSSEASASVDSNSSLKAGLFGGLR